MQSALIGHTGFVGSNLKEQFEFTHHYNSKNISEINDMEFDLVVCAGISAVKWMANKEPEQDLANIDRLISHLKTIKAKRFVLISTVDVYPTPFDVDESLELSNLENHAYGRNRLHMENFIKDAFEDHLIVRLPGLFGKNLKKNVIYDLLNDHRLEFINPDCSFQYYWLGDLWKDIEKATSHGLTLVNLSAEPVKTSEIIENFFSDKEVGAEKGSLGAYNMLSQHAELFGGHDGYMHDKEYVLSRIGEFVDSYHN